MKNNNSAFKLKSGNKPSFMQLRVSDNSPLKAAFLPALIGLLKGGVAAAGGKAALMGAALKGAAGAAGSMAVNKMTNKEKEETKEIMPSSFTMKQSPARKDSQNMQTNQFANVDQSKGKPSNKLKRKLRLQQMTARFKTSGVVEDLAKGLGATLLTRALSSKKKKEVKPIIGGQQHRIM